MPSESGKMQPTLLAQSLAKYIDLTLQGPEDQSTIRQLLSQACPDLLIEPIAYKVLDNGLSNQLVLIRCGKTREYHELLVRIYGEGTTRLIDRTFELLSMLVLNKFRRKPTVYAIFNNGICYSYTGGVPTTSESMASEEYRKLIAGEVAHLHAMPVREALRQLTSKSSANNLLTNKLKDDTQSFLFPRLRDWIRRLKDFESSRDDPISNSFPSAEIFLTEVVALEETLQSAKSPVVLCHNDLLAGNIIITPNKKEATFIDLEFAAFAHAAYDIANHFCEYAGMEAADYSLYPSLPFQRTWLEYYIRAYRGYKQHYEDNPDGPCDHFKSGDPSLSGDNQCGDREMDRWLWEVNHFALVSHLTWAVWAAVREMDGLHEFDFHVYALARFHEFRRFKAIVQATFPDSTTRVPEDFVQP